MIYIALHLSLLLMRWPKFTVIFVIASYIIRYNLDCQIVNRTKTFTRCYNQEKFPQEKPSDRYPVTFIANLNGTHQRNISERFSVEDHIFTHKYNATHITSSCLNKKDNFKIANMMGAENFEYDKYSGANATSDNLKIFSNSYGEITHKRTKRSCKTNINKITLLSLPIENVLEMLGLYYIHYDYNVEDTSYELDPLKNISKAVAKALYEFSVDNLLNFREMTEIFENVQFLSWLGSIGGQVRMSRKHRVKEESYIVDIYIDRVFYAYTARFKLDLEPRMPIYSKLMKYRMDKIIKDTIKKYDKPKRCIP